jgi:integrase
MTLFLGYVRKFVTDISTMNLVELLRNTHLVERFILWHAAERTGGHERTGHAAMLRLFSAVLEANLGKNPTSDQYRAMSNSINKIPAKAFHADLVLDFDRIALAAELCLRDARRDYDLWVAAGKLERDVLEVAFRFMLALLFALLTWRPVRCKNLCGLALDQNLQFHGERGWWLYFSAHETKTGTEIDVPFPALLTEALGIYLEHLRPTLNRLDLPNLFFQDSGKPFSGAALWRSLIPLGEKYLGVPTSSHTFRRLIPTAYLIAHPGEVEVCRALLSHRLVSTTIKHYAFVFTLYASRRLPAFLRESCPDSGLVAVWRPIYLKSVETVLPS